MSFIVVQEMPDNDEEVVLVQAKEAERSKDRYYIGDIVCHLSADDKVTQEVKFGVVCYPTSLSFGQKLEDAIKTGFTENVVVQWFNTKKTEVCDDVANIFVVQRNISLGLRVKQAGRLGTGKVIRSEAFATVRCTRSGQIISNVPLSDLNSIYRVNVGDIVLYSGWLGLIVQENYAATIRTSDGYKCQCKWSVRGVLQEMSDLASRIKFQGQKISLSRAEALHEVTWANPLTDRLRFFRRFSGIEGIVESIEPMMTVKWLEQQHIGEHGGPHPTPPVSISPQSSEYFVIGSTSRNHFPIYGSIYQMHVNKSSRCQPQTYDDWIQFLRTSHVSKRVEPRWCELGAAKETSPKEELGMHSNGDGKHCRSNMQEAVSIWEDLRGPIVVDETAIMMKVELLCINTLIAVRWPNSFQSLDCLQSYEVEPELLSAAKHQFSRSMVVKFSKSFVDKIPSSGSYFGVVVDSSVETVSVKWFHVSPRENPTFMGKTNSKVQEIELHDCWNFRKDDVVITEGLRRGFRSVGRFQDVSAEGFFRVKLFSGDMREFCPQCLRRFKVDEAALHEVPSTSMETLFAFGGGISWLLPSLHNLGNGSINAFIEGRNIPELVDIQEELAFIDLPMPTLPSDFHSNVMKELCRYNGGKPPPIWLKTFASRREIILVAMEGPKFTLYEDVLLLFTVRIPDSYPDQPPVFCYQSYSEGEVNPCLKVDGTVLCPLLDTYPVMYGSRQENWDREDPSLAVILLCINKIMLGPVPFENDAKFGLLKIISTKLCNKICREKNIKYLEQLVDSVTNQLKNPPKFWQREFFEYYRIHVPKFYNRIVNQLCLSHDDQNACQSGIPLPKSIQGTNRQSLASRLGKLRSLYKDLYEPDETYS